MEAVQVVDMVVLGDGGVGQGRVEADSVKVADSVHAAMLVENEGLLGTAAPVAVAEIERQAVVPAGILVTSTTVNGGSVLGGQAKKGLVCPQCGALGINGMSKLMLHIDRMHGRPFTCNICKVEFVDRYHFNLHSPSCYYMCPLEGCNFQDKRESRLEGHLRRHKMV